MPTSLWTWSHSLLPIHLGIFLLLLLLLLFLVLTGIGGFLLALFRYHLVWVRWIYTCAFFFCEIDSVKVMPVAFFKYWTLQFLVFIPAIPIFSLIWFLILPFFKIPISNDAIAFQWCLPVASVILLKLWLDSNYTSLVRVCWSINKW